MLDLVFFSTIDLFQEMCYTITAKAATLLETHICLSTRQTET